MRAVTRIQTVASDRRAVEDADTPMPIWFDSWRQLASPLSNENCALLPLIRKKQPRTVLELAKWSGRAPSYLPRTLRHLERRDLVKLHRTPDRRAPGSAGHRVSARAGLI